MSSYLEATFHPHAALPNEVTILIPNLLNFGETLPVNVPKDQILNLYMTLFGDNVFDQQAAPIPTATQDIRQQW